MEGDKVKDKLLAASIPICRSRTRENGNLLHDLQHAIIGILKVAIIQRSALDPRLIISRRAFKTSTQGRATWLSPEGSLELESLVQYFQILFSFGIFDHLIDEGLFASRVERKRIQKETK